VVPGPKRPRQGACRRTLPVGPWAFRKGAGDSIWLGGQIFAVKLSRIRGPPPRRPANGRLRYRRAHVLQLQCDRQR